MDRAVQPESGEVQLPQFHCIKTMFEIFRAFLRRSRVLGSQGTPKMSEIVKCYAIITAYGLRKSWQQISSPKSLKM